VNWREELSRQRQRYYEEGRYQARTLADEMRDGAAKHGDALLVFHSDTRPGAASVAEMHRKSLALAGALHSLGLRPGDAIAIQVPNWLEGALAFQAAMLLGVVVVPVIHIYGPAEVQFILRESGARALVCPRAWRNIDYVERLERLDRSALPDLQHVIVLDDDPPSGCLSWRDLEAKAQPAFAPPRVAADDVCLLIFTSGTTALPKGVQHTHNTLLSELGRGTAVPRRGVNLSAFPSGHIAGVIGLARLYLHGGKTVLMDSWDADAAARLIEEHRVTSTAGTPFHLHGLLEAAAASGRDLTSISRYVTGAASVPPALVERAHAAGLVTCRSYGSSEHPTVSAGTPRDSLDKQATTDGRLLDGCEVRILDDEGQDLARDREGEIVCRGPELFVGYTDDALNAESFLPGGWFRTGDVGVLDADGYLRITDRKKDIIIRGGENISSKEVEDILARHPAVVEVAAVGMPDERYGERVCAYVILRRGAKLGLPEVRDHFAAAGVARQKTPEHLIEVDELPRTSMGKVRKVELRKRLRE
jgi:acyl-CoA synthetase (AMP-forming)/AMP-acid ligase II